MRNPWTGKLFQLWSGASLRKRIAVRGCTYPDGSQQSHILLHYTSHGIETRSDAWCLGLESRCADIGTANVENRDQQARTWIQLLVDGKIFWASTCQITNLKE